jgi:hypothetical protein
VCPFPCFLFILMPFFLSTPFHFFVLLISLISARKSACLYDDIPASSSMYLKNDRLLHCNTCLLHAASVSIHRLWSLCHF